MVNIDLLVEVRLLVNGLTGPEIQAAFLEKQGIKALVGGTVAEVADLPVFGNAGDRLLAVTVGAMAFAMSR